MELDMTCVILREKKTGDYVTTTQPENYSEDEYEAVSTDRAPKDDEAWCPKRGCWRKDTKAESRRCDKDWDRLPLRARKRIEALEKKVNDLYDVIHESGLLDSPLLKKD